jgi:hypothetical protein
MQHCEIARKCRECADKALALARQAATVRHARYLMQLAETWLRLAKRFEGYGKRPPRTNEDSLLDALFQGVPPADPFEPV